MQTITEKQYNSLSNLIYKSMMDDPDMNMGNMTICKEAANEIVNEWVELEQIIVLYEPKQILDEPPIIEMHPVFSDLLKPFGII
jgi:hypothetical protein